MDIKQLVQLHKDLSDLEMCFRRGGVIQSIDSDDIIKIGEVQIIIEKMIKYLKKLELQ